MARRSTKTSLMANRSLLGDRPPPSMSHQPISVSKVPHVLHMRIVVSSFYSGIETSTEANSECHREQPVLVKLHQGFHQRLAGQLFKELNVKVMSDTFTVFLGQLPMHQYFKVFLDETTASNITDEVIYYNGHTKNGCKISPPGKK